MKVNLQLLLAVIVGGVVIPSFAQTWIQTSAPSAKWFWVASSADGNKLVAVGADNLNIYVSTNSGTTWAKTMAPSNYWVSVASSADGSKIVAASSYFAAVNSVNAIYTSTNSGLDWTSNNVPNLPWQAVTSSADGNKLMALAGGQVYTSSNSGTTWGSNSLPMSVSEWRAGASSADGQKLIVMSPSGVVCVSSNGGAVWEQATNAPGPLWYCVSMSASGNKLIALLQWINSSHQPEATIYTSTNFAQTWVSNSLPQMPWSGVAISADGDKLFAIEPSTDLVSTDGGLTWNAGPTGNHGSFVINSADGNKLFSFDGGPLSVGYNGIFSVSSTPAPVLHPVLSTNITLAWTVPSTNFVLQQNFDLTTTNWSDVTNLPVLNLTNLQNQVTLPLSGSNCFFRLKTP